MGYEPVEKEVEAMAKTAVDCAYRVHKTLGPGLLESVYEACLAYELSESKLKVERQVALPVVYQGIKVEAGLRLDLLIEGKLIIEVKAVESLLRVHHAQVMTYLKLTGNRLGLLMNFNVPLIRDGIKRVIV